MTSTIDQTKVGKILGKVVSGLYIVSLKNAEAETGFLASWVSQAGFNPPMITVAFNKERQAHFDMLTKSGKAVVNFMGKENGKTMSAFFKPPAEGKSVFDDLDTSESSAGIPVLKDSLGYLECEYRSEMSSEDHTIVLLEVIDGELTNEEIQPSTHIRPDGFKY